MIRRYLIASVLLATTNASPAPAYQNPILGPIKDPDCVLLDGKYRLTEPEGGVQRGGYYTYRTSTDLIHWSKPVRILKQPPGTALWQGSFYRDQTGALYFYYTAVSPEGLKMIHVAAAADFTGPFAELGIVARDAIDPYPMQDASGRLWIYFKNALPNQKGIWVQSLSDPATPSGAPVEVLHPEPNTFEDSGFLSVEGPTVIQRGPYYFLLYSGGPFGAKSYAVGYAVARAPNGPFVRGPNNPILSNRQNPGVYSPGVPTVVSDGAGQSWLVYRQRNAPATDSPRELTIDRLDDSDAAKGLLRAYPSSGEVLTDPVPLP